MIVLSEAEHSWKTVRDSFELAHNQRLARVSDGRVGRECVFNESSRFDKHAAGFICGFELSRNEATSRYTV